MRSKDNNFFKDNTSIFLKDTNVENLFINEYMSHAKGDHVKVYIFALMYSDLDERMDNEVIAKNLNIEIEDVMAAWTYWEKMGVIRKHYKSLTSKLEYEVEFINLKQMLMHSSIKPVKRRADTLGQVPDELKDALCNDEIKNMYAIIQKTIARPLESKELKDIMSWIEVDDIKPELIVKTYEYCVQRKNNNKFNYVASFIKTWRENDIKTIEQMEKYMEENDQRHHQYKRIMKAMGMQFRYPTEEEKRIMDSWFDEMQFGMNIVLDACKKTSGISNPNIKYVNSILKAWKTEKDGGGKENSFKPAGKSNKKNAISAVMKSYEEVRAKNNGILEERKKEIYHKISRIRSIDVQVYESSLTLSKLALSKKGNNEEELQSLKQGISKLSGEKAYLLTDNGYFLDYLDPIYDCKVCKDTGILDTGARCTCFIEKLKSYE